MKAEVIETPPSYEELAHELRDLAEGITDIGLLLSERLGRNYPNSTALMIEALAAYSGGKADRALQAIEDEIEIDASILRN